MAKAKTKKVVKSTNNGILVKSHFVVRDLATKMLLVIDQKFISRNKKTKLDVGLEITYHTAQRDRGRGIIVLNGSEEECEAFVMELACESLFEEYENDTTTMKTVNGSSITVGKKCEENININVMEKLIMKEKNVDLCNQMLQKNKNHNETNQENNASTNGMIKEKNDDSNNNIEEMDETTDDNIEEEQKKIDNMNNNGFIKEKSLEYIDNITGDGVTQVMNTSTHTNRLDKVSKTATDKKTVHQKGLFMKRSSVFSENHSNQKRLRSEDDDNYSFTEFMALKEENKQLKEEIEFMKIHSVPRPNPETIDYYTTVLSICNTEIPHIQNSDKLENIIKTLGLNDEELEECVDDKSIRQTCRNIVRKVFKCELMDSTVSYDQILLNQRIMTAIREFGRMKHPMESMKFKNGNLNNAMGSVFYQRGRAKNRKKKYSR